jgi:hypothetical protein
MAAPFTWGQCPGCGATTSHRFLASGHSGDGIWSICELCFAVFTEREDGSVVQRAATDDERAAVPPPVVWSDEVRAALQESFRHGQSDLRAWVDAGCKGRTPELEAAMPPGTLERVRRLVERSDGDMTGPEMPA